MKKSSKDILYILLGISILIISLAVGYYYLIILPGIEKDKLEYTRQQEQQKQILEEKKEQMELETKQNELEAKQNEVYRKECVVLHEKKIKEYENYINICTQRSSIDYCINSDGGKFFAEALDNFLIKCISNKKGFKY